MQILQRFYSLALSSCSDRKYKAANNRDESFGGLLTDLSIAFNESRIPNLTLMDK